MAHMNKQFKVLLKILKQKTIRKWKIFNDFNTVLNLNTWRFDDSSSINGDRPVEIDTLAGMDVDMNDFPLKYLKNSMMSGMGVPRNLN